MFRVGIIGLGFVGDAIYASLTSFVSSGKIEVRGYDKYKNGGIGSLDEVVGKSDILFLCLPTPYVSEIETYDQSALDEVCRTLKEDFGYEGIIVVKSTVLPGTCQRLHSEYGLKIVHNPEFLTARTAREDFHNQTHIVLGLLKDDLYYHISSYLPLGDFYHLFYPNAKISWTFTIESESMKLFVNNFYSVKIQIFNEFYLLCQKTGANYDRVVELMLNNGWISPQHVAVPGPDGKLSYGGLCFPKDTKALLSLMKEVNSPCRVLEACVKERDEMRDD